YIGDLARTIGGERVEVTVLAKGTDDPHFVVPKPSFLSKLRAADLLIVNGADLEVGFGPILIRQANNPKILSLETGLLDLSRFVTLREVPAVLSRAEGDVHPQGNPHFHLDPHHIPVLARAVSERLSALDHSGEGYYQGLLAGFLSRWSEKQAEWDRRLAPLKGKRVIEYHKLFYYFLSRYGFNQIGSIEPKPGIPPSARHLEGLAETAKQQGLDFLIQDLYHEAKSARYLSEKTGVPVTTLPHDVGAVPEATDLVMLFETIVKRLGR
ncbi:MAG: zinc ABC transporter substrate-binding protein, partial [Desulfobacteraceae bacterium]